jgi:UDP-MurNAc hydroxylase
MEITYLGHAGLLIRTKGVSILCDPWFNPAYLYSWFPFPSNDHIDKELIANPDYLFVSHLHKDHFDNKFLASVVNKKSQVIVPDYPTTQYKQAFDELGFKNFIHAENFKPIELEKNVNIVLNALTNPTDGPLGDCVLIVSDDENVVINQNDAHPIELDSLKAFGPFDAHFLQYSGAIWYPVVYEMRQKEKQRSLLNKRRNQLERAYNYAVNLGSKHIFPSAGPPCFLDPKLFDLNDFGDPFNIFYDATVFIDFFKAKNKSNDQFIHLIYPGSEIKLSKHGCELSHQNIDDGFLAYSDKASYLKRYQQEKLPIIEQFNTEAVKLRPNLFQEIKQWFEPLMQQANFICQGINGRILLEDKDNKIILDFLTKEVVQDEQRPCKYRFYFQDGMLAYCVTQHLTDWVNELFLSLRFSAQRDDLYNEYVYSFFKSLDDEKIKYVESFYANKPPIKELIGCKEYLIQRHCPHMRADLLKFAEIKNNVLTCKMHGWQFEIDSGRCLTSDDRKLFSVKKSSETEIPIVGELEIE